MRRRKEEAWRLSLSPDGSKIAFRTNTYQSSESYLFSFYIVDLSNGQGEPVELVNNAEFKIQFDFSPDSSQLVFENGFANSPSVWIANADGSDAQLLADGGSFPDWH